MATVRVLLVGFQGADRRAFYRAAGPHLGDVDDHLAATEDELLTALGTRWDLALVGDRVVALGPTRSLELIRGRWPHLPVVVWADRPKEREVIELLHRGAQDFVRWKDAPRLGPVVGRVLREAQGRLARVRAEEAVHRLDRLHRLLAEANQTILRAPEARDLLQGVCQVALRLGGFDRVRVTQDRERVLITAADAGEGDSPSFWGERSVLATGRALVFNDLAREAPGTLEGWASAAFFPLVVSGGLWGCLSFYSRFPEAFAAEEQRLLAGLALDLGLGLDARSQDLARRESERFLADMATLVPGLFYKLRWDADGTISFPYVSPGIDLLLPFSPQRVMEDPNLVFRCLAPRDRRRFFLAGHQSWQALTVFNLEFGLVRPNGSEVWVVATAFPQRYDDGSVVWTGLALDVTTQNRLRDAVAREQQLLSVVLDHIADAVVAIDPDGRLTLVNRLAARMAGLRSEEMVGRSWTAIEPSFPRVPTGTSELRWRSRRDGTERHLEIQSSELPAPAGQRRGRVILIRDNTERDRIEERLRQSEKLESIGLVTSGIAHDFNNLLTGIFGFVQMAQLHRDQPDRVQNYLDLAFGPFQRARNLTQHLLAFAKDERLALEPVALATVVDDLLEFTLAESGTQGLADLPEDLWLLGAGPSQLHQVLENLILNARQALAGTGRVEIRARNLWAPGPEGRGLEARDYVEFEVRDDGPGMEPDVLAKVFDPFFTTKATGTGLGLSIVFSTVKKHGGAIEVESSPGRGALFRVFWPAFRPNPANAG